MESWDDDNFEPPSIVPAVPVSNKWEGEDEDDEVKDNWEDEEEEKKDDDQKPTDGVKKSKKKLLSEKIAEKERLRREEESRLRELDDEDDVSPEEKLRRQQESDLKIALETTFSASDSSDLPSSKDDLKEYGDNLTKKLLMLSKNEEFVNFADNLIRNLCAGMNSNDIRKIKNSIDNVYLEKQKIEKGDKSKKNKGKGKVKLKMDDGNPLSAYVNEYDDYNDFM